MPGLYLRTVYDGEELSIIVQVTAAIDGSLRACLSKGSSIR